MNGTPGVRNYPGIPLRTIRCDDDLWDAAKAKADREGWNLSAAIRELLAGWVHGGINLGAPEERVPEEGPAKRRTAPTVASLRAHLIDAHDYSLSDLEGLNGGQLAAFHEAL